MKFRRWHASTSAIIVILTIVFAFGIGVDNSHTQSAHAAGYSSQIEVDSNAPIIAIWVSGANQYGQYYTTKYFAPSNQWTTLHFQTNGWWWQGHVCVKIDSYPSMGSGCYNIPYNGANYYKIWYQAW